jgi:hypothetical protein
MHPDDPASDADKPRGGAGPPNLSAGPARTLRFTLTLHAEDEPFQLHWIPTQTAKAVHTAALADPAYAQGTGEWAVVDLGKLVQTSDGEDDVVQLDADDWSDLLRAWADLPRLKLPIRPSEFEPFRIEFERFRRPPAFRLAPMFGHMGTEIYLTLHRTIDAHEAELRRWVQNGQVQPRSCSSMLALPGAWRADAGLVVEDLRKFAAALQIDLQVLPPGSREESLSFDKSRAQYEERHRLLQMFRAMGGKVHGVDKEEGRRGALAELARKTGANRHSLSERLENAAREEAALSSPREGAAAVKVKASPFDVLGRRKP